MESLAENNVDIVDHVFYYLVKKWGRVPGYDLEHDLKGAGFLALCELANRRKFRRPLKTERGRKNRNGEFRRLAFPRIRGAMLDEIAKTYKLNKRDWNLYKKMEREARENSCKIWDHLIIERHGKKGAEVLQEIFAKKVFSQGVCDGYEFEVRELLEMILNKRELAVFWEIYFEGRTVKELSNVYGVTPGRIRNIKMKGLGKVRKYYNYDIFKE